MTTFRVWAPKADQVEVYVGDDPVAMDAANGGWWAVDAPDATTGSDYAFALDGGQPLPDPRSCWQPSGVSGRSRVIDNAAFEWHDDRWRGVPLLGGLVYELHVGTFTEAGTFDAAIDRLDHLVDLGVDVVEVLPVAAFDGTAGWGYDGVALYAVHDPYGGPDGLKRFVDAAHGRGLGVVLDVVYNHLGPSGNYLPRFGPYFTDTHVTPWGPAVNYDAPGSDEVRRFVIDNALTWLREYHLDGLRLDAVHAIADERATHLLEELAREVESLSGQTGRSYPLIAESDLNDPKLVTAREAGGYGLTAQWSDDFHHALWALLSGERQGYYADFGSYAALAKTLTEVFFHDGCWSSFRGRHHGRPVDVSRLSGHRFLGYLQNHDQVGNRATGDRSSAVLSDGLLRVGAALVLTAPFTPMLFMGEEWGASTPWQFFTSFPEPALAEAVRSGRRQEFAEHGWGPQEVPDPQDPATVRRSTLNWSELDDEGHAKLLDWHRTLIGVRRARPELCDGRVDLMSVRYDEEARWLVVRRGAVVVACNLAEDRREVPVDGSPVEVLCASAPGFVYRAGVIDLAGESVVVALLA